MLSFAVFEDVDFIGGRQHIDFAKLLSEHRVQQRRFAGLTSPTTTKSKGSAKLRERVCKVSIVSGVSSVSLARETKFPTTPPSRARASRYASTTMDTIVILIEGTLGQCWLW